MKKIVLSLFILFAAQFVFAWSATYLQGNNWAITCANGTSWSYAGSSAGLEIVGPALCPAGIAAPNLPEGYDLEDLGP